MKTLVVFPLQEELDFFLDHCRRSGLRWTVTQIGRLPVFEASGVALTLARGGTGKAQFALQTQHLLDTGPEWQLVICAGAAGALVDEVAIGDVIVATVTVEHDYRNRFNVRPLPRFGGDQQSLDALRQVRPAGADFGIHFGPLASGDEDIVTAGRRQQLHEATGCLAAAWEGAGGARACVFSRAPFIEIRGVTDAANAGAAMAFEDNLETAMGHVADLVITWLGQAQQSG